MYSHSPVLPWTQCVVLPWTQCVVLPWTQCVVLPWTQSCVTMDTVLCYHGHSVLCFHGHSVLFYHGHSVLCYHGHNVLCCHGCCPVLFRFTPTQLVDGLLDHSHLLSLVIDLTNTTRYYDPKVGMKTTCHHPCATSTSVHTPLSGHS